MCRAAQSGRETGRGTEIEPIGRGMCLIDDQGWTFFVSSQIASFHIMRVHVSPLENIKFVSLGRKRRFIIQP